MSEALSMTDAGIRSRDVAVGIRQFYLCPQESYTLTELARLWCIQLGEVCAIFADPLFRATGVRADPDVFRVTRDDALRAVRDFHVFRMVDIETALGEHFDQTLGEDLRTVPITIHLPRYVVDSVLETPFITKAGLSERIERLLCESADIEIALRGRGTQI
jgi:hypothetical protein